jgi:hypothetical protein
MCQLFFDDVESCIFETNSLLFKSKINNYPFFVFAIKYLSSKVTIIVMIVLPQSYICSFYVVSVFHCSIFPTSQFMNKNLLSFVLWKVFHPHLKSKDFIFTLLIKFQTSIKSPDDLIHNISLLGVKNELLHF